MYLHIHPLQKDWRRQISGGQMEKIYLAVTKEKPEKEEGILEDYLKKDGRTNMSAVVAEGTPGAKKARLSYQVIYEETERFLIKIKLDTGRHHQIRVQMAHAGMPASREIGSMVELQIQHLGFAPAVLLSYILEAERKCILR